MSLSTIFPDPPILTPRVVTPTKIARKADLELRDIVAILWRRKPLLLAGLAIGVILAIVFVLASQKQYSSTATIEINKDNSNELGMIDLSGITSGLGGDNEINMDLLTEQSVITSDNTALSVIKSLNLESNPPYAIPAGSDSKVSGLSQERGLPLDQAPLRRDRLLSMFRSRLHVTLVKGTRLIDITYTDNDPVRSTQIANAIVDAYMNEYTQARYQASSRASQWLSGQLADLKEKVTQSQEKADQFQRESGLTGITLAPVSEKPGEAQPMTTPELSGNVPLERLLELNRDLTNAEVSRIAKEAIYRMTETQDPDVVLGIGATALASDAGPDSPVSPGSSDLMLLQQLREQQAQLKVQIAASDAKYGDKNPAMTQLRNEDAALGVQITAELNRIRTRAKNDLNLAELAEKGIQDRVSLQEHDVDKMTEKADQLVLLQEEALSSRQIYQDLYTKLEEASVTAGIRASNITLVNPARVSSQPSSPKRTLTVAAGAALGLILGLMAAFLWDHFDDSIVNPEEVEQLTAVPILGVIPDFAQKHGKMGRLRLPGKTAERVEGNDSSWVIRAPRSQMAEAYRTLRTSLLLSRAEQPPKVILIMSGSPAEGKSTTCLNTAAAFAIQGSRVLYIDADLRRPRAHDLFQSPNQAGLSNCLTSDLPFRKALQTYPYIDSLFLLPSGPHPPNPSELLGSKRFIELLDELRENFDYIFIDSPPALLVTDAQLLSSRVDGTILVVRSRTTTKRALLRLLAMSRMPGTSVLGFIVNALTDNSLSYSSYGYGGKGGGYYVEA